MAAHDHTRDAGETVGTVDLTRLALSSGEGRRLELDLDPGGVRLGDADYRFEPAVVEARLDVSKTATGWALRLRFAGGIAGPCMRCLGPAREPIEVDAREVDQTGAEDEELISPYVVDGILDIAAWAHDALVLALPQQLRCRRECLGLCQVCGESLNDAEPGAHDHPREPDPRWAKLRELQE